MLITLFVEEHDQKRVHFNFTLFPTLIQNIQFWLHVDLFDKFLHLLWLLSPVKNLMRTLKSVFVFPVE